MKRSTIEFEREERHLSRLRRNQMENDNFKWSSEWIELDSHSDLHAEHTLGSIPTAVKLEVAVADGTKILRSREITLEPWNVQIGYRSVRLERNKFEGLSEAVSTFKANRYRLLAYWDPSKQPVGIILDEHRKSKESTFLDALEEIG